MQRYIYVANAPLSISALSVVRGLGGLSKWRSALHSGPSGAHLSVAFS
jgi:hypothetical protein